MVPGSASTGPDLEAKISLGEGPCLRSCNSQNHIQGSQVSPRAHVGSPQPSTAAIALPEQDVGVRHGTAHLDEDGQSAVGFFH